MRFFSLILLLFASAAEAQQLLVIKAGDQYIAFEVAADGGYKYLNTYKSVRGIGDTPDPPPPPVNNQWTSATGGLHLMVIDDENLRGKLPQSQINVLTSKPLRDWLDQHAAKAPDGRPAYRFSSNDSLVVGGEARKQELPVYVQGWDLAMKSGKPLPLWIVSNGRQTTIEPLPKTVDAAIARLEALK